MKTHSVLQALHAEKLHSRPAYKAYIDGLVQDCSNSIANTLE